jgi:hypothetical protein
MKSRGGGADRSRQSWKGRKALRLRFIGTLAVGVQARYRHSAPKLFG